MNIYQKLIEVRKVVPYLQKEQKGQQYNYVGSDQVLAAVRAKLDEVGLLLIPSVISTNLHSETVEYMDGNKPKKTTTYFTELTLNYTWVNADKPEETISATWYAQGVDIAGEKGVGKALTYAEKYFLMRQFNIPSGKDDPDAFQQRQEQKQEQLLKSNTIALIKSEWLASGGKMNALSPWVESTYKCKLSELDEEQAEKLLTTIRNKRGGGKSA